MKSVPHTVVFDLGGVLIDWNPRHLYRKLFGGDEAAMEHFLSEIASFEWNHEQDAGRSISEGIELLVQRHPDHADMIRAYRDRWLEMIDGVLEGTVDILARLRAKNVPLYALTNWSAETFPIAQQHFDCLSWFKGVVVSGAEKIAKPDPRIFAILIERFGLEPASTVFIDDQPRNVAAAAKAGLVALHFIDAPKLEADLRGLGLTF